ncbi:methylated-DNA--[protein]-cysteine S-methyltransferase [Oleidesulfovibrio alaskensis]|jgi:methylated-DNA-[protein]-cysteine S-methyltransferase|uniref:methylated-DNA--[protein]-cysteine S-methyltransferase n=1 Tax=Oleidesulfovibrio alaskensis TaxID=58180 RepID=UPI000408D3F5|nr:methylated-DNA--[protein]-cysteine S-methyltransferase [Oleidesulfovibrio alaskensis]
MYDVEILVSGPLAMLLEWSGPDGAPDGPACAEPCIARVGLRWSAGLDGSGLLTGAKLPRPGAEAGDLLPRTLVAFSGSVPDGMHNGAAELSATGSRMLEALDSYVQQGRTQWPQVDLPMGGLTPFARKVLETLRHEVPAGSTVTYGQLAAMAGRPAAARGVGQIMARNRWPLVIPCHRVLGSKGAMVGYTGAGVDMKRYLLQLEGASL